TSNLTRSPLTRPPTSLPLRDLVLMHGAEQPVEAVAHEVCGLAVEFGEHVGDGMHPAVGALDGGPEGGGVLEAAANQLAQADEARRPGPLSAARRSDR